jgi:clan AA aspartic protease
MMVGIVTSSDQAILKLQVLGPGGRSEEVEAIIDTGFNGDLALPLMSVAALGLPVIGSLPAALADGSQITLNCYKAVVVWHGRPRTIDVPVSLSPRLIGMSLLKGSRMTMDVIAGGPTMIEELP